MLSLKFSRIRSLGRRRHAMRTTSGNRWNAIELFSAKSHDKKAMNIKYPNGHVTTNKDT